MFNVPCLRAPDTQFIVTHDTTNFAYSAYYTCNVHGGLSVFSRLFVQFDIAYAHEPFTCSAAFPLSSSAGNAITCYYSYFACYNMELTFEAPFLHADTRVCNLKNDQYDQRLFLLSVFFFFFINIIITYSLFFFCRQTIAKIIVLQCKSLPHAINLFL